MSLLKFILIGTLIISVNAHKRQYIGDVKIDKWSGPFFNNYQRENAFGNLMYGDVTGNKRTDFPDIDPEKILNPVPVRAERKTVKDEGPVAETYMGKNPEEDKIILVSPQERLAHFVSKPIIHHNPITGESVRKHLHYRGDDDNILESRRYMFHRHGNDDKEIERHHFDDDRFNYDEHREHQEHRYHNDPSIRREDMFNNDDENDVRFPDHERDRFEDRDEDRERSTSKRSVRLSHGNRKNHHQILKKKNSKHISGKKKSELAISEHIPEALMPGGIPDPADGMESDAANVPALELRSAGEAEGQYMENEALQANEGQPVGTAVKSETSEMDIADHAASDMATTPEYQVQETPNVQSYLTSRRPPTPSLDSGTSDSLMENGTPLSLSGVGLNSHSGVKEMAAWKVNYASVDDPSNAQESSMQQAASALPVNKPPGAGVEEKIVKGEATLQSEERDDDYPHITPEGQKQESVDQNTIFVHHHPESHNAQVIDQEFNKIAETSEMKKHHIKKKNTESRKQSHLKKITKIKDARASKKSEVLEPQKDKQTTTPIIKKNSPQDKSKIKKRWGHSTEHQNGFLEDNISAGYFGGGGGGGHFGGGGSHFGGGYGHYGGGGAYGRPFVMTIGQHEGSDVHKDWNNMHSPGNGFYAGSGVGPARTVEGDYIHHNQHDAAPFHGGFGGISHGYGGAGIDGGFGGGAIGFGGGGGDFGGFVHGDGFGGFEGHSILGEHHDPLHSLEESNSQEDHETAGLIEGIWGHDYDGNHVGHGHHDHGHEAVNSFFGHGDQGTLLPSETLDGFAGGGHGGGAGHWGRGHHHKDPILALQDDTSIDSKLQTMGVGIEMHGHHGHYGAHVHGGGHGHHGADTSYFQSHDVGNYGHHLSGHGGHHGHLGMREGNVEDGHLVPPVDVPHGHTEMSPEEYHNHIDELMNRYHQLEVDMKGQHGSIMEHLDENLLHHHGHPHYHTGYDLYAYQNPWHNAQLPYHIPVENHPDDSDISPEIGGGSMEKGGKDDGKGVEKGGPLVEAKEESLPPKKEKEEPKKEEPKKEEPKKEDDKPPEIHKKPDWTGMPPKIPSQRGGPEQSGSFGLDANNQLVGEGVEKGISKLGPLRQAIAAYKAMNLSIPATLQIQELQEELKLAKQQSTEKSKSSTGVESAPNTKETNADSKDTHKTGDTKDKAPQKAPLPNGAAEVTQAIQTLGSKAAAANPQAAVAYQRLQQLNFLQQTLLKEMLVNAVKATKEQNQKSSKEPDDEQHTVEKILNIGHENDNNVQQGQLLAQLNNMMRQSATNAAFNHLVNSVAARQNYSPSGVVENTNEAKPSITTTADVKSKAAEKSEKTDELNAIVGKILTEAKQAENNNKGAETLDAAALTPNDVSTLDLSDSEKSETASSSPTSSSAAAVPTATEIKENADLISLLNSAELHKKKHHKKKHHTSTVLDDAYAKIGYESSTRSGTGDESVTKKDKANYVEVKNANAEATTDDEDLTTKKASIKNIQTAKKN